MTPDELTALSRTVTQAEHALADALAARNTAIVQAAINNLPKDTVVQATGLTKEQIRRIERDGAAPKRAAGRPRRS